MEVSLKLCIFKIRNDLSKFKFEKRHSIEKSLCRLLKKHVTFDHFGKTAYECAVCSAKFERRWNLLQHFASVHEGIKRTKQDQNFHHTSFIDVTKSQGVQFISEKSYVFHSDKFGTAIALLNFGVYALTPHFPFGKSKITAHLVFQLFPVTVGGKKCYFYNSWLRKWSHYVLFCQNIVLSQREWF